MLDEMSSELTTSRTATPDPSRPQQLRVLHTGEALAARLRLSRSDREFVDLDGQQSGGTPTTSARLSASGSNLSIEALMMPHGPAGNRPSLLGVHSRASTPPQSPQVSERHACSASPSPLALRTPGSRTSPDDPAPRVGSALRGRSRLFHPHLSLALPEEGGDGAAAQPVAPARTRPANLFVKVGSSRPSSADVNDAPTTARAHGLSIVKPSEAGRPTHMRHGSHGSHPGSGASSLSRSLGGCSLNLLLPSSSRPTSAASSVASGVSVAPYSSGGSFNGRQLSQRKLVRLYDSVLSEVAPRIYVGADEAARDLPKLTEMGVTHIINCAAGTCANHHERTGPPSTAGEGSPLVYLALYLQDSLREDISRAFYASIDFIDAATRSGGAVLIHCQHGVSRSATIAMAHLMWQEGIGYEEALERVRGARPTVNPNIGFACALLAWQCSTLSAPTETLAWELCALPTGFRPLSYEPGLTGRALLDALLKPPLDSPTAAATDAPPPLSSAANGTTARLLVFQRGEVYISISISIYLYIDRCIY